MTSSFTVTPDAIVPAAEVAAAAVARTPARWHWDEKKEGSAAGSRECRARRELQPGLPYLVTTTSWTVLLIPRQKNKRLWRK